ncbi:MAG: UvrB/UvrC motif-containing protein [Candidatus Omnitrophota bacterium]
MLCEICGKRKATVHITESINDKTIEMHICEKCAAEKGVIETEAFGMSDLLAGLAGFGTGLKTKKLEKTEVCPKCGMTFEDFKKTGRFGCAVCYETFKGAILPLLQRIHGSAHHFGKFPVGVLGEERKESMLEELQNKLKTAIEKEEFEEAARLRDKIKELQEGKEK